MARVGRVLQHLAAGGQVDDQELLQHREDCRNLMEAAHARWQIGCESREVVEHWQACFFAAHHHLSPSWAERREAQIQAAIARSA